ncbi:MAG: hypothetical protein ACRD3O_20625 [Terriglobia bacterium]
MRRFLLISLMSAFILAEASGALRAQQPDQGVLTPADQQALQNSLNEITIPEGTEFKLQLHTSISSKTSKVGDRLISTLIEPVSVEDITVLHKGLRVYGHISDVKHAGHRGKSGYLSFEFDSIEMPNGEKVAILGSLTEVFSSADSGSLNVGLEGDIKGGGPSHKEQLAMFLAPTAAAAAGGLGPGIAVGVVSGVAAIMIPKGKPAVLLAGSLLGMRLDEDVTINLPPGAFGGKPAGSKPSPPPSSTSHPSQ